VAAPGRDRIAKYGLGCGSVLFLLGLTALCYCWYFFALAALAALVAIARGTLLIRIAGVCLAAACVIEGISHFNEEPTYNSRSAAIPDSLFMLNGVSMGASQRVVTQPPSLELTFEDSQVVHMRCNEKPCALQMGIGVGTTRADVERRLGSPAMSSPTTIRYNGRARGCKMTFRLEDDRVSAIWLWCDR
jgi:hypothetical protein